MTAASEENSKPFSSRDLRDALSSFATGVTIVTTRDETGEPVGMTASSFNSVSMDPPLVLWSVTKNAFSAPAFRAAKHFAVHVLASDQIELSNKFARSGADKFADVDVRDSNHGVPQIAGAATRFDCTTWAIYEGGDHWIIVGEVQTIDRHNKEGLVFGGGSYATAAPIGPPSDTGELESETASPIDNLLFYQLSRAYHQMGDRFHDSVRESGLSLGEWRILASLHGQATRPFADLAARTFINAKTLSDMIHDMRAAGLCTIEDREGHIQISGTAEGHARVQHLFELGEQQEKAALAGAKDSALADLLALLKTVISNTDRQDS